MTKSKHDFMVVKKSLHQNILWLNTSKTKYLLIFISRSTDFNLDYLIIHTSNNFQSSIYTCTSIEKVGSYEYLRVFFDCRLKWCHHIQYFKKQGQETHICLQTNLCTEPYQIGKSK